MLVEAFGAEVVGVSLLVVLAAVDLDYQFGVGAGEVDDCVVDDVLAGEAVAC